MSSNRKWTVAIRPEAGAPLRKITKIVGLNGQGFSVIAPYHKARSGFLMKLPMDLETLGKRTVPVNQIIAFTAADRVKLSYHSDGFAQFSGESPGKVISGRDPQTGEPRGLGLMSRTLKSPPISGPSVGVHFWGIEDFEIPRSDEKLIIFEPGEIYYRECSPDEANTWHIALYAFADSGVPPLLYESEQAVMLYAPHPITGGIPGAVIKLKMLHLPADKIYLGLYADRYVAKRRVPSGWSLNGPGSYNQYQSGHSLIAVYPREVIPVAGRPSLDRSPAEPHPEVPTDEATAMQSDN